MNFVSFTDFESGNALFTSTSKKHDISAFAILLHKYTE